MFLRRFLWRGSTARSSARAVPRTGQGPLVARVARHQAAWGGGHATEHEKNALKAKGCRRAGALAVKAPCAGTVEEVEGG